MTGRADSPPRRFAASSNDPGSTSRDGRSFVFAIGGGSVLGRQGQSLGRALHDERFRTVSAIALDDNTTHGEIDWKRFARVRYNIRDRCDGECCGKRARTLTFTDSNLGVFFVRFLPCFTHPSLHSDTVQASSVTAPCWRKPALSLRRIWPKLCPQLERR